MLIKLVSISATTAQLFSFLLVSHGISAINIDIDLNKDLLLICVILEMVLKNYMTRINRFMTSKITFIAPK